jgi:hypothetical protein
VQLAWKILVGLSVVFGVVTGVATVAKWDWAYPVPLLIALALLAAGLGVALVMTRRDHAAEMKEARQDHTTELAETRQDHTTELAVVRQQHATALADARDHRADELKEAQRARDAALAEAERDRADLAEEKAYSDERARAHDERLFADTRRAVPRKVITWLEDQDFNGPWGSSDPLAFFSYVDKAHPPEQRFIDPELEALRIAFYEAASTFAHTLANYSTHGKGDIVRVRGPYNYPGAEERWEREAKELNALADPVVDAYNALIVAGQARGFDVLDT